MSDESTRQMLQSMLDETDEEEWEDVFPEFRIRLISWKRDSIDDLTDEQTRWLDEKRDQAMADLKKKFNP